MKKKIITLFSVIICLTLCACGNANAPTASTPEQTQAATQSNPVFVIGNTPTPQEEAEITFDTPVVIIDNDYVKITVNGKYSGADDTTLHEVYGYKTVVENKMSNKYININIGEINVDGFMLDSQAGLYATIQNVAPNAKANSRFYLYLDRAKSVELNSINDLKNVTGIIQINFSDDGATYTLGSGPNGEFPFDNKFSFDNPIP